MQNTLSIKRVKFVFILFIFLESFLIFHRGPIAVLNQKQVFQKNYNRNPGLYSIQQILLENFEITIRTYVRDLSNLQALPLSCYQNCNRHESYVISYHA